MPQQKVTLLPQPPPIERSFSGRVQADCWAAVLGGSMLQVKQFYSSNSNSLSISWSVDTLKNLAIVNTNSAVCLYRLQYPPQLSRLLHLHV